MARETESKPAVVGQDFKNCCFVRCEGEILVANFLFFEKRFPDILLLWFVFYQKSKEAIVAYCSSLHYMRFTSQKNARALCGQARGKYRDIAKRNLNFSSFLSHTIIQYQVLSRVLKNENIPLILFVIRKEDR